MSKRVTVPKAVAVRKPALTPKAAPLPEVGVAAAPRVSTAPAPSVATAADVPAVAASPPPTPAPEQSPTAAPVSAPVAALPLPAVDPPPTAAQLPEEFSARAELVIADHLPRISQRAERLVLRVLHAAAQMEQRVQEAELLDAARALRLTADDALGGVALAAADAQRLSDAASTAFWTGRSPQRALELQLRRLGPIPVMGKWPATWRSTT